MKRIKMVQIHQDDASDEVSRPLGIEVKVEVDDLRIEVDIWRLRYVIV